jgi:hypothetical protein
MASAHDTYKTLLKWLNVLRFDLPSCVHPGMRGRSAPRQSGYAAGESEGPPSALAVGKAHSVPLRRRLADEGVSQMVD